MYFDTGYKQINDWPKTKKSDVWVKENLTKRGKKKKRESSALRTGE